MRKPSDPRPPGSRRPRYVVALGRSSVRAGLIAVLAVAASSQPALSGPPDSQKQVLVLYGGSRETQSAIVGDRELPRALERGLPGGLDYYSEFIDQRRYADGDYVAAFRDFLRLKYEGHGFDLVIAMDHIALEFVERTRREMFTGTPVVFFSSRPVPRRPVDSTGILVPLNLSGSVALALALQPDLRHVFVVNGVDKAYETRARSEFQSFGGRLTFTYLSGLPMQTLEAKLAALPPHSIVFYMHVGRDGEHVNVNPLDYLDRIATLANAPTYCWVDSAMGRGIVGGSLRSLVGQSQAMAALSLRILRGERAGDIPLSSPDLNVREVDWRQLRRWSIDDARVPAGTVVRFHEPGFWQRNGFYIVGALVFLLAQSALIGGFVWLRARRRQAEERARGSEAALRASYDRIRDLGARLLNAQETERARIARELHDDISQQLALLEIDLELLGRATDGPAVAMAAVALTRAHAVGSSVHDLSHRLHPAKLRLIGLVAALQGLQHELSLPGLAVTFAHEHVPAALPADLTLCLFRVAQEGVQNAIKYSRARHISVRLAGEPDGLSLTIADDGVGFDVDAAWGKGLGLISMGERVEAIGGRLEIRSRPETGTRLDVRVPRPAMQDRQSIAV